MTVQKKENLSSDQGGSLVPIEEAMVLADMKQIGGCHPGQTLMEITAAKLRH